MEKQHISKAFKHTYLVSMLKPDTGIQWTIQRSSLD